MDDTTNREYSRAPELEDLVGRRMGGKNDLLRTQDELDVKELRLIKKLKKGV